MQLLTVNRLTDSYILAVTGYGMPASFTALAIIEFRNPLAILCEYKGQYL